MAKTFNLTAQLNLAGPNNIKPIINNIRQQLGNISVGVNVKINPSTVNAVANFDKKLKSLNTTLVQINAAAAGLTSTLKQLGTAFNSFNAAGNAAKQITASARALKQVQQNSKGATTEMQEFGKQAALAVRRFTAFSLATGAIFGVVGALKSGVSEAIKFDKEMVKLSQVTGVTVSNLSDISNEITRLSTGLGVSSDELINVATTLAQAGLSAKDTKIALEALAKSSLAPSFKDINETTEASIAIMAQFGLKAKDLENVLGSVNAVSAAFAVEAEDITAAIRRAGGVFATAAKGISAPRDALNEFIAIFSSVRATTRESAETIATGLRTIFTRIQRGGTIELLKQYGVELTDLEGKFVGPYEAVNRLSVALNKLDPRDTQFSQIVEELGGFRQISKVIPLIQQMEVRTQALGVAQEGVTSLTDAATVAQQSLANQFAKVREQFLAFIRSISTTESFKTIIGLTLKLASGLISIADAAKPLIPLLAIIGAVKGFSAFKQIGTGFFSGLKGGGVGSASANGAGTTPKGTSVAVGSNTLAVNQNTYAIQQLTASLQRFAYNKFGTPYPVGASSPLPRKFARGGLVPGSGSGDTVPAMLSPGEFVLRKSAVNSIGAGHLSKVNLAAEGGTGTPKSFDQLSPAQQQKILRAQNAPGKAAAAQAKQEARTLYLDGTKFAGIFHDNVPVVGKSVPASSIRKPASGVAALTSYLKKFGINSPSGITLASKPHYFGLQSAALKKNIADIYPNIEKDIAHIAGSELGGLADPEIISRNLGQQKNSILGSVFEATFKAVAGSGQGLFKNKSNDVFDFYPTTRDRNANFGALIGDSNASLLKTTPFADAKYTGSDDNVASLFGKALGSGVKLTRRASGGSIGGSGTGDTVPALLTPGEFVINKKAASALGSGTLHAMNSGRVRKFAKGGKVTKESLTTAIAALAGSAYVAQQGADAAFGQNSAAGQGLSGAIGGAASGAFIGGQLGGKSGNPAAAVAGAVIGALVGGVDTFNKAVKDAKLKQSLDALANSASKAEAQLEKFLSGKSGALPELNKNLGNFASEVSDTVGLNVDVQKFQKSGTFSSLFGDAAIGLKGFFGGDTTGNEKEIALNDRNVRNSAIRQTAAEAQSGGNIAGQAIEKMIRAQEDLLSSDARGNTILSSKGVQNQGLIESLAFKGSNAQKTVEDITAATEKRDKDLFTNRGSSIDQRKILDAYEREVTQIKLRNGIAVAKSIKEIADKERDLLEAYRNSAKELTAFGRIFAQIGAAAERNTAALEDNNAALDARVANLSGTGTVGPLDNSLSRIIGNKDAATPEEFSGALNRLGNIFDAGNNASFKKTLQFAEGGKTLDDSLVKIINSALINAKKNEKGVFEEDDAAGNSTVTQAVKDGVRGLNIPRELQDSIAEVISKELSSRQGATFEDIIEKFKNADKFAESAKVAQEAMAKLADSFTKSNTIYIQNLNKLVSLRSNTLATGDRAAGIKSNNAIELADAFGKTLSATQLNAPIQEQISRLGGGITDPNQLANKFSVLNDNAADIQKKQNAALLNNDGAEFVRLGKAAADTAVEIDRTKKALELLADGTKKAAIQGKLAELQSKRETQRGVLGSLATAGPQQIFQLMRDTQAFNAFKQNGNQITGGFTQAQGIQNFLQQFGGLLDKDQLDNVNQQVAAAQFKALGGDKLDAAGQALLKLAITKQGEAPAEQQLIAALKDVQTAQQQAANALTQIAAGAENVYGQQIVEQLKTFVNESIRTFQNLFGGAPGNNPQGLPDGRGQFAANGGWIRYASAGGSMFKPRGTDTVPAMLTPGEFVVNARSAQAHQGILEDINASYLAGGGYANDTAGNGGINDLLDKYGNKNKLRNQRYAQKRVYDGTGPRLGETGEQYLRRISEEMRVAREAANVKKFGPTYNKNGNHGPGFDTSRDFSTTGNNNKFGHKINRLGETATTYNHTEIGLTQDELKNPDLEGKLKAINTKSLTDTVKKAYGAVRQQQSVGNTLHTDAFAAGQRAIGEAYADKRIPQLVNGRYRFVETKEENQARTSGGGGFFSVSDPIQARAKEATQKRLERAAERDLAGKKLPSAKVSAANPIPGIERRNQEFAARQLITARAQARAARRNGGGGGGYNTHVGFGGVEANVQSRAASRASARRGRLGRTHFAEGGSVGGSGGYDNFVKAVQSLGTYTDKLAAIRIPETITLTATIKPVQIVFSGENALALAVVEQMKGQLSSMIFSAMKAHINPLTGETNEGSINPSQISNRV